MVDSKVDLEEDMDYHQDILQEEDMILDSHPVDLVGKKDMDLEAKKDMDSVDMILEFNQLL